MEMNSEQFSFFPKFSMENMDVWFLKMDISFAMSNIVDELEKFRFVLRCLPDEIVSRVVDLVENPRMDCYAEMKKRLKCLSLESSAHKVAELLNGSLDGKPSILLGRMRKLAEGLKVEDFVRALFLRRLPPEVQAMLMSCDVSLEQMALVADAAGFQMNSITDPKSSNEGASASSSDVAVFQPNTSTAQPISSSNTAANLFYGDSQMRNRFRFDSQPFRFTGEKFKLHLDPRLLKLPLNIDLDSFSVIGRNDEIDLLNLSKRIGGKMYTADIPNSTKHVYCDSNLKLYVPRKLRSKIVMHLHFLKHEEKQHGVLNRRARQKSQTETLNVLENAYTWPFLKRNSRRVMNSKCLLCRKARKYASGSNLKITSASTPAKNSPSPSLGSTSTRILLRPKFRLTSKSTNVVTTSSVGIPTNVSTPSSIDFPSNVATPCSIFMSTNVSTASPICLPTNLTTPSSIHSETNFSTPSSICFPTNVVATSSVRMSTNVSTPASVATRSSILSSKNVSTASPIRFPTCVSTPSSVRFPRNVVTTSSVRIPTNVTTRSSILTSTNMSTPSSIRIPTNVTTKSSICVPVFLSSNVTTPSVCVSANATNPFLSTSNTLSMPRYIRSITSVRTPSINNVFLAHKSMHTKFKNLENISSLNPSLQDISSRTEPSSTTTSIATASISSSIATASTSASITTMPSTSTSITTMPSISTSITAMPSISTSITAMPLTSTSTSSTTLQPKKDFL